MTECSYRLNIHKVDRVVYPLSWVFEVFDEHTCNWETVHHVNNFTGPHGGEFFDIEQANGRNQFRKAFILELLIDIASFVWLAYGTNMVSSSEMCIDSAPLLWWAVFLDIVSSWAILGSGTLFLVITSITAVVLQTRKNQRT